MSKSPSTFESAPTSSKSSRWWLWLGIVAVLIGVIVAAWFSDAAPPDDAHMMPTFTEGGGKQNEFILFKAKLEGLSIPDPSPFRKLEDEGAPNLKSEIKSFLSQKEVEEALLLWDELLEGDESNWRWWYQDNFPASVPLIEPVLSVAHRLAGIQFWRARLYSLEGNSKEALNAGFELLKFGQGLSQAEGFMMQLMVAHSIQGVAYNSIQ